MPASRQSWDQKFLVANIVERERDANILERKIVIIVIDDERLKLILIV